VAVRDGTQDVVKQSYSYNESSKRLHSITKAGDGSFIYDYFPGTNLIRSVTAPNGVITTYGYEPNTGRLASINASIGSQTLYSISYRYNDNGQRDEAQVTRKTAAGGDEAENWSFDYDEQDQVVVAHRTVDGEESGPQYDYEFDAVGNHTENGWTVNALNQVKHLPGVTAEIVYDGRGNVSYDGHFTYTWDAQDRLTKAQNSVAKFEFGYDSQGRRTWKKSYGWVDNAWVLGEHLIFAYDGWNLLAEFKVVGSQQHPLQNRCRWSEPDGGIGAVVIGDLRGACPTNDEKAAFFRGLRRCKNNVLIGSLGYTRIIC
jgi:hypothetical protein